MLHSRPSWRPWAVGRAVHLIWNCNRLFGGSLLFPTGGGCDDAAAAACLLNEQTDLPPRGLRMHSALSFGVSWQSMC